MTSTYNTWKMVCTNDERHDRFVTCVTVLEEWEVNCFGDHVRTKDFIDTVHEPSPDNSWTCAVCGADAERRDVET